MEAGAAKRAAVAGVGAGSAQVLSAIVTRWLMTMGTTVCGYAVQGSAATDEVSRVDRLRRFLNAYWLRPENAFWMALRSLALSRRCFQHPALDLACGDGVYTFLHLGGALADEFDVFLGAGHLGRVTSENADMFDFAAQDYRPAIARQPDMVCDVGADLKPALLAKAARLGVYGRLMECDANQPLPFADGTYATVYCNSAYWIENVDGLMRELRRVVRPGGEVILHVKLASMRDYTLARYGEQLGDGFLRVIDRGRRECWPTVASRREWEQRIERAGLVIQEAMPFVTRTHAHIWDVGLRPIAPLLVRMANALTPDTRLAIKRDWVELLMELLQPICRPDFDLGRGQAEPAEIQYVVGSGA